MHLANNVSTALSRRLYGGGGSWAIWALSFYLSNYMCLGALALSGMVHDFARSECGPPILEGKGNLARVGLVLLLKLLLAAQDARAPLGVEEKDAELGNVLE